LHSETGLICDLLLFITLYYSLLLFTTLYYSLLLFTTLYYSLLLFTTLYYSLLLFTTLYYNWLLFMTLHLIAVICDFKYSDSHPLIHSLKFRKYMVGRVTWYLRLDVQSSPVPDSQSRCQCSLLAASIMCGKLFLEEIP